MLGLSSWYVLRLECRFAFSVSVYPAFVRHFSASGRGASPAKAFPLAADIAPRLQLTEISPEFADAADVLSDQLRVHLQRLAVFLLPHVETLDRRFLTKLKQRQLEPKQFETKIRSALATLTPGAAARILASGQAPLKFIEQVEYNGRRLAKLNLPPSSIVEALQEYDRLLTPMLRKLLPNEYANFQWVREQLHFCVILTLNNAYYQVREAETQAFYELFRVELESRNLDDLLGRFLETLVHVCHADAGHLYLLNDRRTAWVLRAKAESQSPARPTLVEVRNRPRWLACCPNPGKSIRETGPGMCCWNPAGKISSKCAGPFR